LLMVTCDNWSLFFFSFFPQSDDAALRFATVVDRLGIDDISLVDHSVDVVVFCCCSVAVGLFVCFVVVVIVVVRCFVCLRLCLVYV